MATIIRDGYEFLTRRFFLISWISLVVYLFYTTFIFYKTRRQFYYLREILGIGLCISRGTATVLNICCALVLLPLCKKLNQLLYRIMSKLCPGVFFFWLEKAKSFHMTVAVTLVLFSVIHSMSHFVNLWNFSRNYDETREEINFANYKNENPLMLLMSPAGLTGVSMLTITLSMGLTSMRIVRRRVYNAFWYTHQLYLPFMALLIVHPLSGVLKEELLSENRLSNIDMKINNTDNSTRNFPVFVSIQSKTWMWMSFPLTCFFLDLLWRICSRNRATVDIIQATHMAGRTVSLTLSCQDQFNCRAGQYVLLQCLETSRLEWHPFTVVKVPTSSQRNFIVWIRVKGDWTDSLERLLLQNGPNFLNILVDGPFSSPMEGVRRSQIAVCVAAGVGITPFVATLQDMLLNPRNRLPGRIHLLWIVRHERELTWLAALATKTLAELRNANRPDRLHLELYVTNTGVNKPERKLNKEQNVATHVVLINEKGSLTHVVNKNDVNDERVTLLTPNRKRRDIHIDRSELVYEDYSIAKEFPHLACRVRRGRPHWDRLFGYWVHLYPEDHLNLYCCGPKKLVKLLRHKCKHISRGKTKFTFVHEVGLWPDDQWAKNNRFIYKIYDVSLHVLSVSFLVTTGIGTYRNKDNVLIFMANLDKSLVAYYFVAKVIIFVFKRKRLEILITEILHSGDQISEDRKKLMLTHVVVVTCLSTSIAGAFSAMALYKNEMTVEAWMPFDPMKSKMNLALAAQLLAITFVVPLCRSVAMQGIVCGLIMYVCDQLKDLQDRIRSLEYTPEKERAMRKEFSEIVKKHVRLMGYSQEMNKIFKEYFLIQNLAVTVELCLNALMATTVGLKQQSLLASFVAFLCVALLNAYIYCYLGNELIIQSEGIALAAYESMWTTWPLDLQKDLLILIRAAQKPLHLSAGGMAAMSLQTYSQTLYNGYSIFAVLNDVVD